LAQEIGWIAFEWNRLEEALAELFADAISDHQRALDFRLLRQSQRNVSRLWRCSLLLRQRARQPSVLDDLGPPWPQHRCTDNPREPDAASLGSPTRRTRGLMQELITAANVAGLFKNKVFGRRTPEEWTLLIVVSVERGGEEGTVTAEFLDSQNGETTQFKCRSAEPILELGDFVSVKGNEISLVHKPTLIPIRFIVGAYRRLALAEEDRAKADLLLKLADESDRGILCTAEWLSARP
jgi:hypothetical protein